MRVIKQRLREMLPDIRCFLDVDDLEDISDLEGYIARSHHVLVFCSEGYFGSKNCMRELAHSVALNKPMTALVDFDPSRGGLGIKQIAGRLAGCAHVRDDEHSQQLYLTLFEREPIEWNRIGPFQDCTLRQIAERLLGVHRRTCVAGEMIMRKPSLPLPRNGRRFHLYCSRYNEGADALLLDELREHQPLLGSQLRVSMTLQQVEQCEHMLVYLNGKTWTMGAQSEAFAREVALAMRKGVHLLLAHEMPGPGQWHEEDRRMSENGGQNARHGVDFGSFFEHPQGRGATPTCLLRAGIYRQIAIALKVRA